MPKKVFFLLVLLSFIVACRETSLSEEQEPSILRKEFTSGPLSIFVEISPQKPTLADRISFLVRVEVDPVYEVLMPQFDESLGRQFYIYNFFENPVHIGKKKVYSQRYQLETLVSGEVTIPGLEFRYQKGEKPTEKTGYLATSDPFALVIASIDLNDEGMQGIYDIRDVAEIPPPTQSPWFFVAAIGAVMLLVGIGFFIKKYLTSTVPESEISPQEYAWKQLKRLLARDYIGNKQYQEFYFELTMIVREYIEKKYEINAPGQTTEEFLQTVGQSLHFSSETRANLRSFMEATDMVKYAAQLPSAAEVEHCFEMAKQFMGIAGTEERL